jgi:hypothetical protein
VRANGDEGSNEACQAVEDVALSVRWTQLGRQVSGERPGEESSQAQDGGRNREQTAKLDPTADNAPAPGVLHAVIPSDAVYGRVGVQQNKPEGEAKDGNGAGANSPKSHGQVQQERQQRGDDEYGICHAARSGRSCGENGAAFPLMAVSVSRHLARSRGFVHRV